MSPRPRHVALALILLSTIGATAAPAAKFRAHRVSPVGDPTQPYVDEASVSPDGKWIVWVQYGVSPHLGRLYSEKRWEGSAPIPLTAQIVSAHPVWSFFVSADSRHVVFWSVGLDGDRSEIWSVPIEGGPVVRLSPVFDGLPGASSLSVAADRAVFVGSFRTLGVRELWSAPIDGSSPAVLLHDDPAPGSGGMCSDALVPSRDGTQIAFCADLDGDGHRDLWVAPADGSTPALRLNSLPGSGASGVTGSMEFTPDDSHVLYLEFTPAAGIADLWSVPSDGSSNAILLTLPSGTWSGVRPMEVAPNSSVVAVAADHDGDEFGELWALPVAGPGAAAIELAASAAQYGQVSSYRQFFDPTGARVFYEANFANLDQEEVWSVPADGSSPAVRLNPPVTHAFAVSSDVYPSVVSGRVLLHGNFEDPLHPGIWVSPVDGSAGPIELDTPGADRAAGSPRVCPDGAHIVFVEYPSGASEELEVAPLDGSAPAAAISPPPAGGFGSITSFWVLLQDPWVVYLSDRTQPGQEELWAVPTAGPPSAVERFSPVPVGSGQVGDLIGFTPDTHGSLYNGNFESNGELELWISDSMVFRADFDAGNPAEWSSVLP